MTTSSPAQAAPETSWQVFLRHFDKCLAVALEATIMHDRAAQAAISAGRRVTAEDRERPSAHPEAAQERETPTPECNAKICMARQCHSGEFVVPVEFARSLERSRDQWKQRAEEAQEQVKALEKEKAEHFYIGVADALRKELFIANVRVAEAEKKSDEEMLRVKACEHIAEGEEGWEKLRNECPSTAAVASLRDALTTARQEAESLRGQVAEQSNKLAAKSVQIARLEYQLAESQEETSSGFSRLLADHARLKKENASLEAYASALKGQLEEAREQLGLQMRWNCWMPKDLEEKRCAEASFMFASKLLSKPLPTPPI